MGERAKTGDGWKLRVTVGRLGDDPDDRELIWKGVRAEALALTNTRSSSCSKTPTPACCRRATSWTSRPSPQSGDIVMNGEPMLDHHTVMTSARPVGKRGSSGPRRLHRAVEHARHAGLRALLTPILKAEWESRREPEINEGAVQYPFALRALTDCAARDILDVGTGTAAWPQLLVGCGFRVTAIDEIAGYWGPVRFFNRHFYVQHADIRRANLSAQYDAVTCLNVMSTIAEDRVALAGMLAALHPGGRLVLSFPYNETAPVANVYELPEAGYGRDARYRCRIYARADVDAWLEQYGLEIIEQEYYRTFGGELWTMGGRETPRRVSVAQRHHFTAIVLRRR
jgi:SAM-dependent methyltransferase